MRKICHIVIFAVVVHASKSDAQTCDWDVSIGNPGMDRGVTALAVHDDGAGEALYAGGQFFTAGGAAAMRVAKWDGQSWSPLGSGLGGDETDFSSTVHALTSYDDGTGAGLYAGGSFNRSGTQLGLNGIAVWIDDQWKALDLGVRNITSSGKPYAGEVYALTVFDDGSGPTLHVAGNFALAGNLSANSIAKWDGSSWSALGAGLAGNCRDMVVYDDGTGSALYVTGDFTDRGSESIIAKWDGSKWARMPGGKARGKWENYSPCPIGPFCPYYISPSGDSLGVFNDGRGEALYLSGFFTAIGATRVSTIAAWTGRRWSQLSGGPPKTRIDDLVSFDDGSGPALYVGASRWNGKEWSILGDGLNAESIGGMVAFDDGTGSALYVGGNITAAGNRTTHNIARWKCDD